MAKPLNREFTEVEIKKLVDSFKGEFKQSYSIVKTKKKDEPLPDFYPTYNCQVKLMNDNLVHAEKGYFPEALFKERSPNETEQEFNYRKANYKQITLPVFVDFISTISRAMHDANWSIEYSKEEDARYEALSFQKYAETQILKFGSVEEFVKSFLITYKIIDANGVIAVKPMDIQVTTDEENQIVIDDDTLIEPQPYYYSSKQIISYFEGEYVLIKTDEKSEVEYAGKKDKMGLVFEFYDKQRIWKVIQIGKYTDFDFKAVLFFEHNWDKLPVKKLLGVPMLKDGEVIYQSPFSFAVDNLDIALLNNSNLQIATGKCAFPVPVMYGSVCDFEDAGHNRCMGGTMNIEGVLKDCPKCNGSGLRTRVNPMGTILLHPPTRENEGEGKMTQPPLQYVSPSSEILEFLEKSIDKNEAKARKILHLRESDTATQFNPDTATTSNNDMKATYSFIKPISDQVFGLYEFILNAIGYMRYGELFKPPVLHYPVTFDFKTENDYLIEINNAVKVGLPPFALHKILFNYLTTIFFTEKDATMAFSLIVASDRLFGLTRDEITLKLSKNLIAGWEDILHQSGFTFIQDLVRDNPNFLSQDIKVQIEQLIAKAKAKETELKPASPAASAVAEILAE